MTITKRDIDQAFSDWGAKYEGTKEDYFALLYLMRNFFLDVTPAAHHVTFGGNDYGIDAFYVDPARRNLYLFQFKWSDNYRLFKDSFERLVRSGIERVFGKPRAQDQAQNQLLLRLRSALAENRNVIDQVVIRFVFNGDPEAAENSAVLDSLREELEAKRFLIDAFFDGRQINYLFEYVSNKTLGIGGLSTPDRTHKYEIAFHSAFSQTLPTGEVMHLGVMSLLDLLNMYRGMSQRFFERNIRSGLAPDRAPNRAVRTALKRILLDSSDPPELFTFNHNGVSLAAEHLRFDADSVTIVEPRLLNGAQTVTSAAKFIGLNEGNPLVTDDKLSKIKVLAKVIEAPSDFAVSVAIANNMQNPVEPWNLRANDRIQLELQDKFRDDLRIFYERQEAAFKGLTTEELEDQGIEHAKAIQLRRLAQTFLAIQGEVDKVSRLPEVFEAESQYRSAFRDSYLRADSRDILLCYKIQFRLRRLVREIIDKGQKYQYLTKGRNLVWALLCQALLNHKDRADLRESYGMSLGVEADFSELLKDLASRRVRLIIGDAAADSRYQVMIGEERYEFLRSKAMFSKCMDVAYARYGWTRKSL